MRNSAITRRKALWFSVVSTSALLMSNPTQALQIPFNENSEFSGKLDITVGYATAIRAEDRQPDPNALGKNELVEFRVPDKGDQFSNVYSAAIDFNLDWRNYGFVSSAAYQYDTEIMDGDAINPLSTSLIGGSGVGSVGEWSDTAKDYAGNTFDLLNAYFYGSFDVGENPLEVRVGKQVINWGEGLFFVDGVSAQTPLNINKLTTPGTELKQAFVGTNAIYGQLGVGEAGSISAYYQAEWKRSEMPIAGTQYGVDPLYRGNSELIAGSAAALGFPADVSYADKELKPDDSGQWGISYRDVFADDYELGLYYSRYHEKLAFFQSTVDTAAVIATGGAACSFTSLFCAKHYWPEDIDMFGVSLATTIGDLAVSGEIAYRPDRPLVNLNDGIGAFGAAPGALGKSEHDTINLTVNALWIGGAGWFGIDNQQVLTQFGVDHISGDTSNVTVHQTVSRNGDSHALASTQTADSTAYGVAAEWTGTWTNVMPATDLSLAIFLQHDIEGYSHFYGNFAEGRTQLSTTLTANLGNEWEASVGYTRFDQDESDYEDLDSYQLSVNYKF